MAKHVIAILLAIALICASALAQVELFFVNVGKGDAILLKSDDYCALIDTGKKKAQDNILRAMEEKGKGKFIPVTLKNGEPARRDYVAGPAELDNILSHVCRLVGEMAQRLHEGQIEAEPVSGGTDACAWCPYGAVCGHEKDDPVRPLEKLNRAQAMEKLRKEEEHGKKMD